MISIIKIGGNVVDNPDALCRFVRDFAQMPEKKILVHGGGKEATRLSEKLGIETTMIEGRRVTSRETLGCNAIGLSGADAGVIKATKRPASPIDYGFVGDINPTEINNLFINSLLDNGITPVFCAITHDGNGTLLNCNADSVASSVAVAMSYLSPAKLIYCFEKDGVLRDIDNPDSLIADISRESYSELRDNGTVNRGMIPKIDNAFAAIAAGVESVTIKHSDNLLSNRGTTIKT